jgi:hypothetical protein
MIKIVHWFAANSSKVMPDSSEVVVAGVFEKVNGLSQLFYYENIE